MLSVIINKYLLKHLSNEHQVTYYVMLEAQRQGFELPIDRS